MKDIPKDILVQARSITAGYWAEIGLTSDAEDILAGQYDDGTEIALATRAIMAERSRLDGKASAVIERADASFLASDGPDSPRSFAAGVKYGAGLVRDAIRRGA